MTPAVFLGIIAPMFYLAIGCVPLAMVYKAINTLDSMVGYKNAGYRDIGWFSAKMDDMWSWRQPDNGVVIRDCRTFQHMGDRYFRVAVRKDEQNIILIEKLKQVAK